VYGPRRRRSLEPTDILAARHQWLSDGVAPLTIVNRESALRRLWHQLDGRKASTPFDDLSAIASHRTPIVVIPPALVLRVYAVLTTWRREGRRGLHDSKTRARFMVYASTGRRPSEIARAQFTDVDFQRGIWYPRDGKGGFSPGIYLNADMLAAWSLFAGANAWGRFRNFTPILRKAGWPDDVRPYNLRHTVGITMSEAGVDLADVGPHLGHKRLETTRRHYVPVLHSRLQQASERIDKRFGW
jgi:integrase